MRARSFRPELIAFALIAGSFAARAEDVVYGPDGAPTVVQRKLYTMSHKWETSLLFGIAMNTALVDQVGGLVGVTYHPNEWLDLGVEALFNRTQVSGLADNVRFNLCAPPRNPATCRQRTPLRDELANDNQLRFGAFGMARLAPIYGKVNLASEVKIHFQAYLLGGGGVLAVHRESVNLCATPGAAECTSFQVTDAMKPAAEVGGGFRFYLGQRWSVRTEVRGYFFMSSYKEGNDLTVPSSGSPKNYLAAVAMFNAGVSYLF